MLKYIYKLHMNGIRIGNKLLVFTLLICGYVSIGAQNEVIKALEEQFKGTEDEILKIDILNKLSYEFYQVDIEKNPFLWRKSAKTSKTNRLSKGNVRIIKKLGY